MIGSRVIGSRVRVCAIGGTVKIGVGAIGGTVRIVVGVFGGTVDASVDVQYARRVSAHTGQMLNLLFSLFHILRKLLGLRGSHPE